MAKRFIESLSYLRDTACTPFLFFCHWAMTTLISWSEEVENIRSSLFFKKKKKNISLDNGQKFIHFQ